MNSNIPAPSRKGFSLVLALVIMGMMILLVVSLVSFIAIEMQLTQLSTDRQRARLNAVLALNLARGQLQQEAGPDQRVTAQANVTIPIKDNDDVRNALRTQWKERNPYWTGVWDTRSFQIAADYIPAEDRPPAWLVSGKNQLHSLVGRKSYQSVTDYKTPWFKVPANSTSYVRLFSKLPDSIGSNVKEYPFETHVSVPKVDIFSPDGSVSGHYAWWTADEGVKARLNLRDRYPDESRGSVRNLARLIATPRGATELIPHWNNIPSDSKEPAHVLDVSGYANIEQLKGNLSQGGVISNITTTYAHAVTAHSQGLLTDVRDGGLKQDLSLVFEMGWSAFEKSPFGRGSYGNGSVTLNYTDPIQTSESTYWNVGTKWNWDEKLSAMEVISNNNIVGVRPVFNITTKLSGGNIRGPAWELLRDYYRLYQDKEIGLSENLNYTNFVEGTGILRARTFYPGIRAHVNTFGSAISHIFNSQDSGGDPFGGDRTSGRVVPRPLRIAAPAYMSRYAFALGVQQIEGNLRIVMFPFVAVRNPFNVPLRIEGDMYSGGNRAAKVGYRVALRGSPQEYATPVFNIRTGTQTISNVHLSQLFGWNGNTDYGGGFSIALYVPEVTIPPGETWIFTTPDQTFHTIDKNLVAEPKFNLRGGWVMDKFDAKGTQIKLEGDEPVSITMSYINTRTPNNWSYPNGTFVREQIKSWPYDNFNSDNPNAGYVSVDRAVSEHSEPFMIVYDPNIHGDAFTVSFPPDAIPDAGVGLLRTLGIAEFLEKPADWGRGNAGLVTASDSAFPLYAMSNPLTSTKRPDAQVRWNSTPRGRGVRSNFGFHSTSPSWHFSFRRAESLEQLAESTGNSVYAGNSITARGQTKFISAYIPRAPMLTLGQFQTACLTVADHQALYSVGHSFPTPYIKPDAVWRYENNWTNYDHTWLINSALWDHFYFSSIAPKVDPSSQGIPKVASGGTMTEMWDKFRKGDELLLNQSFVFNTKADVKVATNLVVGYPTTPRDTDAYLKSAGLLFQNGTFNINSTDERAWKAILGGTRDTPVPTTTNDSAASGSVGGKNDGNNKNLTPLPRFAPLAFGANDNRAFAYHNDLADVARIGSWKGAKALDDTQLEKLAQAIVTKIRYRWSFDKNMSELNYKGTDGVTKINRPFFSLAEFVNRALLPVSGDKPGNGKLGVLQAAIFHADKKLGANINGGMYQDRLDINRDKLDNAERGINGTPMGHFPAPEVADHPDGPIPVSAGAPGTLLQGDILQAIGSKISARSDTFTIRTYGDVGGLAGGKATGRAWLEAIVQRTPEYVDDSKGKNGNAPHDPRAHSQVKEGFKEKLSPVNKYLGRRFRIVSVRWLSENEL